MLIYVIFYSCLFSLTDEYPLTYLTENIPLLLKILRLNFQTFSWELHKMAATKIYFLGLCVWIIYEN